MKAFAAIERFLLVTALAISYRRTSIVTGQKTEASSEMSCDSADSKPTVQALLAMPSEAIVSFLGGIYEHSSWVAEAFVDGKQKMASIETVTDLANSMKDIVDASDQETKMKLLLAHPDLNQKVEKLKSLTKESQEEQSRSGLGSMSTEEERKFTELNTAYKEKFKFPFILAVRNASKYTVLAALQGRVNHTLQVEFAAALAQVHKIAWMRLLMKLDTSNAKGFLTCHVLDTANGIPGE